GKAPSLVLCMGSIKRGPDRGLSIAETASLGLEVRQNAEVKRQSRQMPCGVEFRNGSLEAADLADRSVVLHACPGGAIEHGDRAPNGEPVPPRQVVEHRDAAAALLVSPGPKVDRAGPRKGIAE